MTSAQLLRNLCGDRLRPCITVVKEPLHGSMRGNSVSGLSASARGFDGRFITERLHQIEEPAMYPECPLCGSQDCERTTHQMKVWFVCRKCGHRFEW